MIQASINKLSSREKKILYITIAVGLVVLFDRLFLGPVTQRLRTIDDDINTQKNSVRLDARLLQYKDKILDQGREYDRFFSRDLQEDDDINTEFFRTVERLASESKVTLIKSNPSEPKRRTDYVQYFANLDCTGRLNDIITFMYKINTDDNLFKVVKFNMSPRKGTEGAVTASMTIVKMIVLSHSSAAMSPE